MLCGVCFHVSFLSIFFHWSVYPCADTTLSYFLTLMCVDFGNSVLNRSGFSCLVIFKSSWLFLALCHLHIHFRMNLYIFTTKFCLGLHSIYWVQYSHSLPSPSLSSPPPLFNCRCNIKQDWFYVILVFTWPLYFNTLPLDSFGLYMCTVICKYHICRWRFYPFQSYIFSISSLTVLPELKWHVPDLRGEALNISPLSMIFAQGFL